MGYMPNRGFNHTMDKQMVVSIKKTPVESNKTELVRFADSIGAL
jgi:hypothetical protein